MVLVCCAVWAAPTAAMTSRRSAGVAPAGSVVLGDSFQPITAGASRFWTSGNYLLLLNAIQNGASKGWSVINDQTGATTLLDPRCNPAGLGPPWVLMNCSSTSNPSGPGDVELYSLTDGTQHAVTLSPGMPYCSSPPYDPEVACSADAVGVYWIEWVASSYHHLPTEVYFQNIQTGELRSDPTNAETFADLNSPALAHRTCPGVQLMRNPDPYDGVGWGSLTAYGQFALATNANGSVFLERCGSHMRRRLVNGNAVVSYALASNTYAVVWQAVTGRLNGLFLPSLQTFAIPLGSAIGLVGSLGLTSGALYVSDAHGVVWRSASPTVLPFNTSRPTLTRSGGTLSCRRGRWRDADRFSYAWRVNGMAKKDAKPRLVLHKARKQRSVSCGVTASNAMGTTTASSAQLHVRRTATNR